ncbi:MAG: hypothetical protein CMK89_10645 [Pseudomonadales bacterium]|nr:hypothetical protein [Pseudomonadales bacterium]
MIFVEKRLDGRDESSATLRRAPLVKGFPVLESAPGLLGDPLQFMRDAYLRYGSIFRVRALNREYTVLAGVEANRFVAGEGKHCFSVESFWGKVGEHMGCPHMVAMVDGDIHKYQRKVMAPLLAQQAFSEQIPRMADNVDSVLNQALGSRQQKVDHLMRLMVSNQLSELLLGRKASADHVKAMIYAFNMVTRVYAIRSMPQAMLYSPRVQWAKWITNRELRLTLKRSRRRQAAGGTGYLEHILAALDARPDWFGEGDKLGHALLPYVAALDTIASTKGFMLRRLLADPALYRCVQQEVDQAFAGGIPDLETLKAMASLNGLCREVMRLEPAAFGMLRSAACDFAFKGYHVSAGDELMVFTTADHMNPEFFPDPYCFDMTRYSAPRLEHKQSAYAPFGKGPHNCLGASLTELILPLHMGVLLHRVLVKPACDLNKVRMVFRPAPVLSENFKVSLSRRRP